MKKDATLYDLTQALAGAIFMAMAAARSRSDGPAPDPPLLMQFRRGRAESPGWFLIQAAEFDPEPVSVANLRVRDIYASERIVFALLEMMASEKWLVPVGQPGPVGQYNLSELGRDLLAQRVGGMRQAIATLESPLAPDDLGRLETLMGQVVTASLAGDEPPGNWCLRYSRNRAPAADAPPLVRIMQYTADFNAYRDDAHMAAFRPLNVTGHAWEAFSFVHDGLADTAEAIDYRLNYRGYSAGEYGQALDDLVERGWLSASGSGRYSVTAQGREIRQEVERLTNNYFFGPWEHLSDADFADLCRLMVALREGLQP